jgi:hypothetical protein
LGRIKAINKDDQNDGRRIIEGKIVGLVVGLITNLATTSKRKGFFSEKSQRLSGDAISI